MEPRYKTFPPGIRHLRVPVASRRGALAGIALYPACRSRASWVQRLAWELVTWLGPRALPGRSRPWEPPFGDETWISLIQQWQERLGSYDGIAVYQRSQPGRSGFGVLLLQRGDPISFIKIRRGSEVGERERRVLEVVRDARPRWFSAPLPMAEGWIDGWHWLAMSAIPPEIHRVPVDPPLKEIVQDIEESLACLPRNPGVPEDWKPMHGDLAPWNLRQLSSGRLVLLDWERAGYGPPGADRVYYVASESAVGGFCPPATRDRSAVAYWLRVIDSEGSGRRDARMSISLKRALTEMNERSKGSP